MTRMRSRITENAADCIRSGKEFRRSHARWIWLTVAALAGVLVLFGHLAAGQTQRGVESIERAMAAEADLKRGANLYRRNCASCHGRGGAGNAKGVIPSLAGQLPLYLMKQLVDLAEANRDGTPMHRVASLKDVSVPQSMRDLSAYLSKLPHNPRPERGDGTQLDTGGRAYDALCAFCHGRQGEGNEAHATPSLQGQHYSYLMMQMRRLAAGHRYAVNESVVDVLDRLPLDYLTGIADYTSGLPASAAARADEPVPPEAAIPAEAR